MLNIIKCVRVAVHGGRAQHPQVVRQDPGVVQTEVRCRKQQEEPGEACGGEGAVAGAVS